MAIQVFRPVDRVTAAGAAADGAGILRVGRAGIAESARALVPIPIGPRAGIHLSGTRDRVDHLQFAVRGAADDVGVLASRCEPDQRVGDAWRVAAADVRANRAAAVGWRRRDRRGAELCAYARRI